MGAWYPCQVCQHVMVRFAAGPPPDEPVLCRACLAVVTPAMLAQWRDAAHPDWRRPQDAPEALDWRDDPEWEKE
jgi:hypothetical protein